MQLVIPTPKQAGGFSDRWKPKSGKNMIRVFPFLHEGTLYLAAEEAVHFDNGVPHACTGTGCVRCAEAASTNNKRLRLQHKYRMAIVDTGNGDDKFMAWPAPSSAYTAVSNIVSQAVSDPEMSAEDIIGNEGTDIIIEYAPNAQPQNMYQISIRLKGSKKLKMGDAPDMIAEAMSPDREVIIDGEEAGASDDSVQFTDEDGNVLTGTLTGAKKGKKLVIEAEGRLYYVDPSKLVDESQVDPAEDTSLGEAEEDTSEDAEDAEAGKDPAEDAEEAEDTSEDEGEYAFDDDEYDIVVLDPRDGEATYAVDTGKSKKIKGKLHFIVDIGGEEVAVKPTEILAKKEE